MNDVRMTFNCQWYPQFEKGEVNSGISIVDPSGYVPAKERIENIMRAGERLDEYRRELYHYGENDVDDENYEDPMMEPGLDLADVHRMRREAIRKLAEQAAKKPSDENSEAKNVAKDRSAMVEPSNSEAKPMESPAGGADQTE